MANFNIEDFMSNMQNASETYKKSIEAFSEALNRLVEKTDATVFDIASIKKDLENILRELPVQDVRNLKDRLSSHSKELSDVLNKVVSENDKNIKEEEKFLTKINDLTNEIDTINQSMQTANAEDLQYLQNKKNIKEQELQDLKEQHEAFRNGNEYQYQLDKELRERQRNEEEKHLKEVSDRNKKVVDTVTNSFTNMTNSVINLFASSVNNITSVYEQHAGTLAAALDQSVSDISNLQHKIANELRDESLSSAISNIAVLTEAANLAKSGYTNEDKLQENATSFAVAKEVAPNIDFSSSNIKYLTNIFGSDFIDRFSAIQTATQETAGATINITQNLSKMMSDLEPVYANAEYSVNALQATSDVQATLSYALDQGIIDESQSNEYLNMISELMDPSKAFTSNSTAVKVAATNYDFGSGDPMQALEALLNAREQMYSGIDMSNSYSGNISRSLAASAYGDNTMSATYMQSGLYGLDLKQTDNLKSVSNKDRRALESGDYTTTREEESNILENSSIAQGVAELNKWFPLTYATFSGLLFAKLTVMPQKIANAIKATDIFGSLGNFGSGGGLAGGGSKSAKTSKTKGSGSSGRKAVYADIVGDSGNTSRTKSMTIDNEVSKTTTKPNIGKTASTIDDASTLSNMINNSKNTATAANTVTKEAASASSVGSKIFGKLESTSAVGGKIAKGASSVGNVGSKVISSGIGATAIGGITGLLSLVGQWDKENSLSQNLGFGGDYLNSALSYAGMGATAGAVVGSVIPGVGNIIGTGVGTLVGGIGGLIAAFNANRDAQEENTEALKEQSQTTKSIFGENIKSLTEKESDNIVSKGGGVATINNENYQIAYSPSRYSGFASGLDYVPYDNFVARLHKGESIVTAQAADIYRKSNPNFWMSPSIDSKEIVSTLEQQTESIVNAVRGNVSYQPLSRAMPKQQNIINR